LRASTFRAQLDSTGNVSALLEQRFAPTFAFLVSGEIDHFKVCILPLARQFRAFTHVRPERSKSGDGSDD
jgi:Eukaryotic porin